MSKGKPKLGTIIKKPKALTEKEYKEEVLENFKRIWKYGHPLFYDLIIEMCKIHEVKNKSYGIGQPLGNFMESERFGIPAWKGCLVRMSDKVTRVYNLTSKMGKPEYADAFEMENLEDTLLDLANYSILCLILLREAKKKPLFKKVFTNPDDKTECESTCSGEAP